ncbi:MAG: efflux RND transporter periplasmic adaptor subunit [Acetobacteraceae bacterium]|nr:efflux RND transporter periplasmic adaptor subunit [Acetobacteraceae bacterium]
MAPLVRTAFRVIVALLPLVLLASCKEENKYEPPPPPEVGVSVPLRQQVTPYLELTGSAVAYNDVDLVARVEGFLSEIAFKEGGPVKQGTTLFVIEPEPYQAKFQQAQAAVQGTQAELVAAEADFSRQATLLKQNVSAQSTYDQALAKRDALKANLADQQAGVTIAAINYGYTRVAAPFDGIVTDSLQSVGQLVGTGQPTKLASIVQLRPIYVTMNVSEQDALRVRASLQKQGKTLADLGVIPVEVGLMTEDGYPHQGKLDYVNPGVDPSSGTLMIRAIFDNEDRGILPGNFLRVRIPTVGNENETALLVPDTALGTDQGGRYLLVVNKDDVVEQKPVQLGQLFGGLRQIDSGIGPDDRVLISGLQRAVPGSKVAPKPATIQQQQASAAP